VHPGVVQQDAEHFRDGRAGNPGVGRSVLGAALQTSAVLGEEAVPPFLRLPQQLSYGDRPGGGASRLSGAGQAQHLLHRVVQAVRGGQRLGQHGPQPGVVVLGEARLQGELQAGERGAQLVGGVGGEVTFAAQEF
jgi:hypothetical protein